mmetsp:Transcript_45312/g.92535  ORF Transcript_45312/g.92535 Transcript_45312/m.92535 type:complete len:81 (+) Transcript_45312:115-357(+)
MDETTQMVPVMVSKATKDSLSKLALKHGYSFTTRTGENPNIAALLGALASGDFVLRSFSEFGKWQTGTDSEEQDKNRQNN